MSTRERNGASRRCMASRARNEEPAASALPLTNLAPLTRRNKP